MSNINMNGAERVRSALAEIGEWLDGTVSNENDPRPMAGNDFDQAALTLADGVRALFAPGVLELVFENLLRGECTFWACRGPESPPEDMITCHRCTAVHELRRALG